MKYTVCVSCWTFNHRDYINDALNGFSKQQTNFPFICTIVDDASTDGNQAIINSYFETNFDLTDSEFFRLEETQYHTLKCAKHKTNKNCYFAVFLLKENHYRKKSKLGYVQPFRKQCKYIALCEGDDYWTDPLKLQKQVDFMESHQSFSLYFHNVATKNALTNKICGLTNKYSNSQQISTKDIIIRGGDLCPTCSLFYRTQDLNDYPDFCKNFMTGDYPLQIYLSLKGNVYYSSDCMGVYRIFTPGSWSDKNRKNVNRKSFMRKQYKSLCYHKDLYNNFIKHFQGKHETFFKDKYLRDLTIFVLFCNVPKWMYKIPKPTGKKLWIRYYLVKSRLAFLTDWLGIDIWHIF